MQIFPWKSVDAKRFCSFWSKKASSDLGQKRQKQEVSDWNYTRFYSSKRTTVNQEPGKFILAMNIWRLSILALARRLWSIGNDTLVTCKQQNRSYRVPFYFNLNSFKKYKSYIKKKSIKQMHGFYPTQRNRNSIFCK